MVQMLLLSTQSNVEDVACTESKVEDVEINFQVEESKFVSISLREEDMKKSRHSFLGIE